MNSNSILYGLICGHAAPGPETLVSGTLVCAWCATRQQIVSVIEYEWRARCRNCTFARWAGLSKHNANVFANGHVSKWPSHSVIPEYCRNPKAAKTAEKMRKFNGATR
jgi:hypothetical protein